MSSFVCSESLGFSEAVSKQPQQKSPCRFQEKTHRHLLVYVYTTIIGIASQSIEACFLFTRWWNTSAVNHRLKFLKLLLSWGTNMPSQNINDECLLFIDSVCICLFHTFADLEQHQQRVSSPLHELHLRRLKSCQKALSNQWCLLKNNAQISKCKNLSMIHHDSETYDPASSKCMWQTKLAKSRYRYILFKLGKTQFSDVSCKMEFLLKR